MLQANTVAIARYVRFELENLTERFIGLAQELVNTSAAGNGRTGYIDRLGEGTSKKCKKLKV